MGKIIVCSILVSIFFLRRAMHLLIYLFIRKKEQKNTMKADTKRDKH